MALEKTIVDYKSYGKCLRLANGSVELLATLEGGPRIIRFGFIGGKNEFCEAPEHAQPVPHGTWRMMGGHRLWTSPEYIPATYTVDDQPVAYELTETGAVLTSVIYDNCRVQKQFVIEMDENSDHVKITNNIFNRNPWQIEFAAWALTVMAPGGTQIMPQNNEDTGLLHNRNLVLWSYTKAGDARLNVGDEYILFKQDASRTDACKIGFYCDEGWAGYVNDGVMFLKRYTPVKGGNYPDAGCSYETYTIDFMMEMESLSPLTRVAPDGCLSHTEDWSLYKDVAFDGTFDGAAAIREKYVR